MSVHPTPVPRTIADGQQVPTPCELTWPVIRERVDDLTVASDAEIVEAMRFLFERVQTVASRRALARSPRCRPAASMPAACAWA